MKRLYRTEHDSMIGGVCAAIARKYDWDPTLVRLGVAFTTIFTGFFPVGFVYLIAWAIIPKEEY